MPADDEIHVSPELSEEFTSFEEFCADNAGNELAYLEVVAKNPLEMDPVTRAFSMRHLLRLSRGVMDLLLESLNGDTEPSLKAILAARGIDLDKRHAQSLRDIVFAFRDASEEEAGSNMVRALQLMTMSRERKRVILNLGESYNPPDEGWLPEDFGGDDSSYETVRAIEDPRWTETQED